MADASRFSFDNDPVPVEVENGELQCADCRFVLAGSTIECEKYAKKPGYVLYRTKPCPKYEKAEQ